MIHGQENKSYTTRETVAPLRTRARKSSPRSELPPLGRRLEIYHPGQPRLAPYSESTCVLWLWVRGWERRLSAVLTVEATCSSMWKTMTNIILYYTFPFICIKLHLVPIDLILKFMVFNIIFLFLVLNFHKLFIHTSYYSY